jgi:hypothetical protein
MRMMLAALALAGAAWGCDLKAASAAAPQEKKSEGPLYTATLKIDDV